MLGSIVLRAEIELAQLHGRTVVARLYELCHQLGSLNRVKGPTRITFPTDVFVHHGQSYRHTQRHMQLEVSKQ